jgi:predicted dehydrogenase
MSERLRVAIVGLGFGAEFIPIYQRHPAACCVALCQRTPERLAAVGEAFGIARRYTDYAALLRDPEIDAVHLNTPIHEHAPQAIAALEAGKHVACTVPAATTVEECRRIVAAARASGKQYMMMETVIWSREFLYVRQLRDAGRLGRIQFLRGSHLQNMAGWPGYWEGLPPMHYATHCVSPCLALVRGEAESVACLGSGRIAEPLIARYGSSFSFETAHFTVRNQDLAGEVTRYLFGAQRQYRESFDVYGSECSFEWQQIEGDEPVLHLGGERCERVAIPDFAELLPESIRPFTTRGVYDAGEHQHLSFVQGSGHGGSHPHLVHEFVSAIHTGRPTFPDVYQSTNWTMVGILAHESALRGGAPLAVPDLRIDA